MEFPQPTFYEVDASRQSTRVECERQWLFGNRTHHFFNDNLLKRCTPEEIQTVMGHEMGHYVLNHVYKSILFYALFLLAGFAFLNWSLHWTLARWGERWQIRGITDVAVLPLAVLLLAIFFFRYHPAGQYLWTPRTQEYEADIFGLDAGRQPDGEARRGPEAGDDPLDPGPLEEFLFYDHPSGRTRITAAMRWKKENMNQLPDEPSALRAPGNASSPSAQP